MTARCCALYFVIAELIFQAIIVLVGILGGKGFSKARARSRSSSSSSISQEEDAAAGYVTVLIVIGLAIGLVCLPNVLILLGVLTNSESKLKWGTYIKTGFVSLVGFVFIIMLISCPFSSEAKDPKLGLWFCVIMAIFCAVITAWVIWGLWAANAYYAEITGVKILPCCCMGTVAPVPMRPGNALMMYPGLPSYAPAGSAVMMQPSNGQLSEQQQQQQQ